MKARKLRVLHLRQSRRMYGPEKTILGFCRGLKELGHECEIALIHRRFAGDPERHPMGELARAQGTPYEEIDGRLTQLAGVVGGLRRRLRETGVEVLHTHDYKADLVGMLATRGMPERPALVSTPRHSESEPMLAAFQWLDRQFLDRFDRITESSEEAWEQLRAHAKLRDKTRLVRHGTEAGSFGEAGVLPVGGPVVSMVGRFFAVKGQAFFLRAMARVAEQVPGVQVWLAGEGPLEGELRALCGELGMSERVHFLGYRTDVDQILRASQATVVASQFETSCRTAMEALELGCPLVATPVGIIPEMVGADEAGLLAPYGDVEAMAAAVCRLLQEPELAERLRRRGRERSAACGSHQAAAAQLAAVYAEALEAGR